MMTVAKLRARTVKDLVVMAKRKKVPGWHSMRKDELVKALVNHARAAAARAARRSKISGNGSATQKSRTATKAKAPKTAKTTNANGKSKCSNGQAKKPRNPEIERRLAKIRAKLTMSKDLARQSDDQNNGHAKDRLVVMVRDPYWLHAYWELSHSSVQRAKASLGQYWHGARPVLRLCEVSRNGTTSSTRKHLRDIEIHGGVNNWYIDVQDPPKSFQLEIGYVAAADKFISLAKSNLVTTPQANCGDSFDNNWSEVARDFDRIYAMSGGYADHDSNRELKEVFEEQLRRPMGDPMSTQYGIGAGERDHEFSINVGTELIVHGETEPDAHVTLRGEPIHLRSDGTFAVRFTLPDRRHVLPVVASSGDGVEQRTIVLAIDRNTKVMEPVIRDPGE